jgi:hypothetical protein
MTTKITVIYETEKAILSFTVDDVRNHLNRTET